MFKFLGADTLHQVWIAHTAISPIDPLQGDAEVSAQHQCMVDPDALPAKSAATTVRVFKVVMNHAPRRFRTHPKL
jgi:hypothetical protein